MIKQWMQRMGLGLCMVSSHPALAVIELHVEEPRESQTYSGAGQVRGWAVSCDQPVLTVEMRIDETDIYPIPYGGPRGDVLQGYPDWPNAFYSGFAMAVNFNNYAPGAHQLWVRACTVAECATVDHEFQVTSFGTPFIAPPRIGAATTNGSGVWLIGVEANGQAYDVHLSWRPAVQQWVITGIEPGVQGAPLPTEFLPLINGLRASRGLPPLVWDDALALAARTHSQDMADENFSGQAGSDGSTFVERAYAAGYIGRPLAENLAFGVPDALGAFEVWLGSAADLANMADPEATRVGYGSGYSANTQWQSYHTMMTGR